VPSSWAGHTSANRRSMAPPRQFSAVPRVSYRMLLILEQLAEWNPSIQVHEQTPFVYREFLGCRRFGTRCSQPKQLWIRLDDIIEADGARVRSHIHEATPYLSSAMRAIPGCAFPLGNRLRHWTSQSRHATGKRSSS